MTTKTAHPLFTVALSVLIFGFSGCAQEQQLAPQAPKEYSFWPAAPDSPHVQFLVSYDTSADLGGAGNKFDEMLYGKASELGITKPYGLAMWNGRIYVTDLRAKGVVVLDLRAKQTRVMGLGGAGEVQKAVDVGVASNGIKYVIDSDRNVIAVFGADEKYITTFTLPNFNPVALCVYGNELYVSDFVGATVKVLDASTGRLLRTIGSPGPDDGHFVRPLGIRVDNQGNLLVADVFKCRIQKFTRDGKFIMGFGQSSDRPGDFVRPKHMAVSGDGEIFIVDAAFNNVQVFDDSGKVMGFFGAMGSHPGSMDLPAGICVTDSDLDLFQQYIHPAFQATRLILVTNQFGPNKVAVYAEGQLKAGMTLADINSGRANTSIGLETANKGPTTGPITMGSPLPATEPTTAPAPAGR